jgi:PP-loop superfamily ATP-utilizing enzyme
MKTKQTDKKDFIDLGRLREKERILRVIKSCYYCNSIKKEQLNKILKEIDYDERKNK